MAQAQEQARVSSAGAKVTVASKMPNGFVIRGFRPRKEVELVLGGVGTREVTVYRETGESVTILGTAVRAGQTPPLLFGGYRMTPGVPKDLWDQWLQANCNNEMVKDGLVFAHEDTRRAEDEAKGYFNVKTGLEGVDPNNPGKSTRSNITRMERPKQGAS